MGLNRNLGQLTEVIKESGGKIGIGNSNPIRKLEVASDGANWISGTFSGTGNTDKVVIGNLATPTIGGHNSALNAWSDFTIAGANINFSPYGSTAMRLFDNGNVFIGSSPVDSGYKLEVSGTGRFIGSGFGGNGIYSTGANGGSGIYSVAGGSAGSGVYGFTNDLSSYGGTFQNSGAGAGVALRVIGFSTFSQAATFSSTISLRGDSAANNSQSTIGFTNLRSGTWNNAQIEVVTGANVWSGKLVFKTASDSFANVLTERMRIDSSYVTTSNVYESFNTASGLHFGTSGSGGSFGFIKWDAGGNYVYLGNSYNSAFNRNLVITSSGNVGIGANNPAFKLTVQDTGSAYMSIDSTGNDYRGIIGATGSGLKIYSRILSTSASAPISFVQGSDENVTITSGGNVLINTQTDTGQKMQVAGLTNIYSNNSSFQQSTNTAASGSNVTFNMGSNYGQGTGGDNIAGLVIISVNEASTNIANGNAVYVGSIINPRGSGSVLTQISKVQGAGVTSFSVVAGSGGGNAITVNATLSSGATYRANLTFIGGGGIS